MSNAGEDGSVIVGKILEKDQYSYGFDAQTGEYANLISKGIIDRPRWFASRSRMQTPWRRS
jgi:chaperonin GroEL (HSP60 family)